MRLFFVFSIWKESNNGLLAVTTSIAATTGEGETALPPFATVVRIKSHGVQHRLAVSPRPGSGRRTGTGCIPAVAQELVTDSIPAHLTFLAAKVATHRAIDAARKRKAHAETSLEETDEPTVLERVHDSFLSSYLQRMVASLPEKQRSVMVLRYQEDMELEEIAKILEMNVSTVKTQISRALELLRGKVSRRLGKGNGQ